MKLTEEAATTLLASHDHGVLCTHHADRGIDAVPVVYVKDADGFIGVPVDRVKSKSSLRLGRERNLEADPRATLLIEHWDRDNWAELWWVRAELRWQRHDSRDREATLADELCRRYSQYRVDQPFASMLIFRIVAVSGWAASIP